MADEVPDEAFARTLQQMGAATFEQLEAARAFQAQEAQRGLRPPLTEVLVQQGVITPLLCENVKKKLLAQQEGGIRQLGHYKLLKKLGEGGMGAVYMAEDTQAGRMVAVKVLQQKFAENREFLTRFRREAIATGRLNHVNIVVAYTVGEDMGVHYYVMEYCDGETLEDILERSGAIRWDHAVGTMIQAARGLKHAHEHGILHRDIKPGNIFVCKPLGTPPSAAVRGDPFVDGFVAKILDLGLSKNVDSSEASFTQTGVALGTPYYISPEQAKGEKEIDGRTDIYSLGATFYHAITGHTPFEGSSAAVVIMKHLNAQLADPRDLNEAIPEGVVHIMRRMMAKDPRDRHANCDRLLQDLEMVMDGQQPVSRPLDPAKSSVGKARRVHAKAAAAASPAVPAATGRRGTRRQEPVGRPGRAATGTDRQARDTAMAMSDMRRRTLLFAAGGVGLCLLIVLIICFSGPSGGKAPVAKKAGQQQATGPAPVPPPPVSPLPPVSPTKTAPDVPAPVGSAQREREAKEKFDRLLDGLAPDDTAGRLARLEEFAKAYSDTMVASRARVMMGQIREKSLPPLVDAEGWLKPIRGEDLHGWSVLEGGGFERHGPVRVKDGVLTLGEGQPVSGVVWRGSFPATDLELECEARRDADRAPWLMTFPLRGMPWAVLLTPTEVICGPLQAQGLQMRVTGGEKWMAPDGLQAGQWYRLGLRVQEPRIGLMIDGEKRLEFDTSGMRAQLYEDFRRYFPIAVCTLTGGGAIRNLRVRSLRPPLPPPDADGWIALFDGKDLKAWSGIDASVRGMSGSAQLADGLLDMQGAHIFRHALAEPNLAVRLRGTRQATDGFSVGLRYSCDGATGYAAFFNNRNEIGIVKTDHGQVELLGGRRLPPEVQGNFEIVFSVDRETLSLALNGQEAVRVRDASFSEGCIVLNVHPTSRLRFSQIHARLPVKAVTPAGVE